MQVCSCIRPQYSKTARTMLNHRSCIETRTARYSMQMMTTENVYERVETYENEKKKTCEQTVHRRFIATMASYLSQHKHTNANTHKTCVEVNDEKARARRTSLHARPFHYDARRRKLPLCPAQLPRRCVCAYVCVYAPRVHRTCPCTYMFALFLLAGGVARRSYARVGKFNG